MSVGGSSSGMGTGTGTGSFGAGIGGTGTGRGSSMRSDTNVREGVPQSGFDQRDMGRSFEQRGGPASGFDQQQFGRSFDQGVPSGGSSADRFNQNRQFEFNRQLGVDFDNDGDLDRRDLDFGANNDDRFLSQDQQQRMFEQDQDLSLPPDELREQRQFDEQMRRGQLEIDRELGRGQFDTDSRFQQPFSNEGRPSDQFGNPLPFGSSMPNNGQQEIIRGNVIGPEDRFGSSNRFSDGIFNGDSGMTDREMQFSDQDFNRDFDRFSSDGQFDRGF